MNLSERIDVFVLLGKFLQQFKNNIKNNEYQELNTKHFDIINKLISNSYIKNPWFIKQFVRHAIIAISSLLTSENLNKWLNKYSFSLNKPKRIGVIMAGNIPLVGFHDFLSVLISGNIFIGKLSSKDDKLLKEISNVLISINPDFESYIYFTDEKLTNFEAVIATGSNNTSRYFNYYFGKYPNIIRKNRNSIAVLSGNETTEELNKLTDDIFLYFGLGCRNISKIYIPEFYDLNILLKSFQKYAFFINHSKYMNNYDYNKAIYLIDRINFIDNNTILLTENLGFSSPLAVLFYERYNRITKLTETINTAQDNIQCVIGNLTNKPEFIPFGKAQQPELWDYADNIDTMQFLINS